MMETTDFRTRDDLSGACRLDRSAVRRVLAQSEMRPALVIQVDNTTPIILRRDRSVIHGTRGSVVLSSCMRSATSKGTPCVGAVSRRCNIIDP